MLFFGGNLNYMTFFLKCQCFDVLSKILCYEFFFKFKAVTFFEIATLLLFSSLIQGHDLFFCFFFEVLILCSFGGISMPGISFCNFHVVTIFCKFQSYDFFFKIQCYDLYTKCQDLYTKFFARTCFPNLTQTSFQI